MNVASTLPEYLSSEQGQAIEELVEGLEFLPISCLFHRGDEFRVIHANRIIPDDFIYFPSKGALDCKVGDESRLIKPGEFIMVPAGQHHGVTMAEGIEDYAVYALHMHLYDLTRYRFLKKLDSPFGAVSDPDAWMPRLAACTCLMGRNPETGGLYMERVVADLLVEQLLRGQRLQKLPVKTDQRIARLLARIRMHPSEHWTVTRMAEQCHLSVSRFRELFVACTGTPPKKYVQKVRLSLARSLLMTMPSLTVEQVADRVGISDAHYFHAIYKKRFGETPRHQSPDRRL